MTRAEQLADAFMEHNYDGPNTRDAYLAGFYAAIGVVTKRLEQDATLWSGKWGAQVGDWGECGRDKANTLNRYVAIFRALATEPVDTPAVIDAAKEPEAYE